MSAIDWSIFDKYPENTVYCRCEAIYRSHTKVAIEDYGDHGKLRVHCRKPCPACGSSVDPRKVSSDVEEMTIGKKEP